MDGPRQSPPAVTPHDQRIQTSEPQPALLSDEIREIRELILDVRQLLDRLGTPAQHPA